MSLFSKRVATITADQLIPSRYGSSNRGTVAVNNDTALRHSAVWACLRLRANLISTMPVDVYRRNAGIQIEVPTPAVLVTPGGEKVDIIEWMHSTQFDLDRAGNVAGLITERDGWGFPARIDLVALGDWTVKAKGGEITKFRIGGKLYDPSEVWHEKQYPVGGLPVGLSPVAYAAWSIGEYLSIQDFALEWFGNSTVPAAHLRNSEQMIDQTAALAMKERFRASVRAGEPFVTGKDWEYNPLTMAQTSTDWLDGKQYGVSDVARFFDCPGDLIDAAVQSGNITYASITQRNLQFLIMHLGPAIIRREAALTRLIPKPRFVKLNTDALLRMDPQARGAMLDAALDHRRLAPSEVRALDDLPPFTDAQIAEFSVLYGSPNQKPTGTQPKPTGVTP